MIRKWAKIIPYGLLIKWIKNISPHLDYFTNANKTRMYRAWQIDKGEFLLVDVEQDLRNKKLKLERELDKIESELSIKTDEDLR